MRCRLLALLAGVALWPGVAWAQIDIQPTYAPGEKIVAKYAGEAPAGAKGEFEWTVTEGVQFEERDNGKTLYVWAKSGEHRLDVSATFTLSILVPDPDAPDDPTKAKPTKLTLPPYLHFADFTVTGAPGPTPVRTLRELVGDDAKAAALAEVYAGQRKILATGVIQTSGIYRQAHDIQIEGAGLKGHGATAEIASRIDAAIGKADVRLTEALIKSLDDCLAKILADLGQGPNPPPGPPVVEGKRHLVIIRETEDSTPDLALLLTDLRDGEHAAYLSSKGHKLDILDDDLSAPIVANLRPQLAGMTMPALFILDAATGAMVHKQTLPASAAEVINVVKAHGG